MRIGAHTYLFTQYGQDQAAELEGIFETVAEAGFGAIELHRPMLDAPDWETRIPAAAARTGLEIVGVSHSQPLWDVPREDAILAEMEEHADRIVRLGGRQCGLSCSG